MRYLALLFAVFFFQQLFFAQSQLLLEANGAYNSSTLPKKIPQAFFYGGFLDSSFLTQTHQALTARNTFGLQMHANFQYQTNKTLSKDPKKLASSWSWLFGAGQEQYSGMQFSKDAFGFVFLGGAPFVGDTLNFSNTRIQSISFSKVGFGVYNPQNQTSLQFNLIGLQNLIDAKLTNTSWFQDPVQDSIHINITGNGRYTTRAFSAIGLGLDFDYRFNSETDSEPIVFQLKIQNFGFAYQIAPLEQIQLNGTYHYGAFDLQDLQQLQFSNTLDSALLDLGFERTALRQWTLLPASIQLSKMVNQDSTIRVQAYYGAQFILRQTYLPLIFAGAHFYVTKNWQTGIGAAYGGFGGLRAQAYSAFTFNKYQILVRTDNATLQKGASIYLQFKCDL